MNPEKREFASPNPDINQKIPPQYAYDLERQAGAVQEAQRLGRLCSVRSTLKELEEKEEAGARWYLLKPEQAKLFSGDCDEELARSLVPNDVLTVIVSIDLRPDVFFGSQEYAVAAVLTEDGKTLYKSPGFDLEAYMQEQSLNKKEKKGEK